MSRNAASNQKSRWTAKTADKHRLYEESVQNPEVEVDFISQTFKELRGNTPLRLREDFCGTGLLCSKWVQSHPEREAVGLDLEPSVLAWGLKHNIEPLGAASKRVTLMERNVIEPPEGKFDAICAFNYSYFTFKKREQLRAYFEGCKRSLAEGGMLFLDAYGGPETQTQIEEETELDNFSYVWDQDRFNPIDNSVRNYIHFRFNDGSELKRAFTYNWRLWQLIEIQELLTETGFTSVDVYWEGADEDGEGNGEFVRATEAEEEQAWNAYIVAAV